MLSQEVQAIVVFGIPLCAMALGWRAIRAWQKREEHEACMRRVHGAMLAQFEFERVEKARLRRDATLYMLRDWKPSSEFTA